MCRVTYNPIPKVWTRGARYKYRINCVAKEVTKYYQNAFSIQFLN